MLQISSGRGPAECEVAVGLYLEVFQREHPRAVVKETSGGWSRKLGGRKITAYQSVLLEVPEEDEAATGAVKWCCASPLRANHGRKNWFIEVCRLNLGREEKIGTQGLDPDDPDRRIVKIETFHCRGKGGQNVNKVETGVRAIHLPTGMTTSSITARTQGRNKKLALERLAMLILTHNLGLDRQNAAAGRRLHDQLERGNPFAVFAGLEFQAV